MIKTRLSYRIFLEEDDSVLLEVRGKGYSLYEVNGYEINKLSNKPYSGKEEDRSSDYLDFVSGETIESIELLTTVYDPKSLIDDLQNMQAVVCSNTYSYVQFDMDMAETLCDGVDILKSLEVQNPNEYQEAIQKFDKFSNDFFFQRESNFSEEEKEFVRSTFNQWILVIRELKSN